MISLRGSLKGAGGGPRGGGGRKRDWGGRRGRERKENQFHRNYQRLEKDVLETLEKNTKIQLYRKERDRKTDPWAAIIRCKSCGVFSHQRRYSRRRIPCVVVEQGQ